MGKGTKNSQLEELEQTLDAFCAKEYRNDKNPMTGRRFVLYAVDGGGYDITDDVVLKLVDGELTITIITKCGKTYQPLASKTFKLILVEDE